jgi:phosphoribosylformimino-5-aminoimidazole carboxamide ribotide isomerase
MPSPRSARVIPVVDLMGGQVVHARRGERGRYRPIESPLAAGSDPVAIARALLERCPAPHGAPPLLYVADLDALTGGRMQQAALARLLAALPTLQLWLDAGFATPAQAAQARAQLGPDRVRPVIASESLADAQALCALATDPQTIVSLDCRHERPMDPAGLWQRPELWPATVIVMTLDRVGADAGPDFDTLARLRAQAAAVHAPVRQWVGAGGLRHAGDLAAAGAAGAQAWLVASALHDGRLDPRTAP